ncbi:MAG: glycosyltransferase family 4 protein [Prevotella sp.]|nr:glycosyltransferase family 4 protein [Bacteroides sp.]MCM1365699.1 glycosyltransferase family 4 protein [Prevotella sp.]MCM1436369.1 glycosyltransferase family 4 protein [Prevotella sp.]
MTIIEIVPSWRRDSISRYALCIARGVASVGAEVLAVTREARTVDSLFSEAGIRLVYAPLRGYLDIPSALILNSILKKSPQGSVIHVHRYRDAFMALLARKLSGRKDIFVVSTRHKVRRAVDNFMLRRVYRNLDAQIFVSQLARDRFLSTWKKEYPFDPSRLHVIFPTLPYDTQAILPMPERGAVTALFIGQLEPGKGLEILIDALYRLREARGRLRIYGTGNPDYVDSLRRRAQARGVMEMIDWKKDVGSPEEMLGECHFGVMPSVSPEAFGFPSLYFLSAGRPMVATNNGAQTEYLQDNENSLLVPPANAAALGEALLKMASDTDLRQRLARGAFHTYRKRFSFQRTLDNLTALFKR